MGPEGLCACTSMCVGGLGKACLEVMLPSKHYIFFFLGGGVSSAVFGTSQRSLLSFRIEIGFVLRLVGRVL